MRDVIETLCSEDGQFNEEIGAYVSAYPIAEDKVVVELEYVDPDNDDEVVDVKIFTVTIEDG